MIEIEKDVDIIIDSFINDLDIHKITSMPIITVYKNPKDYPGKFVARLFNIKPNKVWPTKYIMLSDKLIKIHQGIPPYMVNTFPQPNDDPTIQEVWI